MLKAFLLFVLLLTGCKNLELRGSYSTDSTRGIDGGTKETEIRYTAIEQPYKIIISSRAISDIKQHNKPKTVVTSIEIWFW
jgi:hypothetical protein